MRRKQLKLADLSLVPQSNSAMSRCEQQDTGQQKQAGVFIYAPCTANRTVQDSVTFARQRQLWLDFMFAANSAPPDMPRLTTRSYLATLLSTFNPCN